MTAPPEHTPGPQLPARLPLARFEPYDEVRLGEWQAGREAGRRWAREEAAQGRRHRLQTRGEQDAVIRFLITDEGARRVFGGECADRSHAYARGFIDGASEVWQESARCEG